MASLASHVFLYPIRCSSNKPNNQQLNSIKINETSTLIEGMSQSSANGVATKFAAVSSIAETEKTDTKDHSRQNIPTKKQLVDPYRQGSLIDGGVGYRQTVVIRSYEVGPDKTATLESILNLLQETALNHARMSGLLGDGFGATHAMMKNDLIWVVTRLQLLVDSYPIWGEVLEVDTWVGASGKNGMIRDWLIRSHETGHVFARATSTWVMMNQKTRRLSKMPEEVRGEISPWFVTKQAIPQDVSWEIKKLDDKAKYACTDLKPKRSDLDMNHHVNDVKCVRWMLETIPDQYLESHQLSSIILEYRKECGSADVVQSLCEPEVDEVSQGNDRNVLGLHGMLRLSHMQAKNFRQRTPRRQKLLQLKWVCSWALALNLDCIIFEEDYQTIINAIKDGLTKAGWQTQKYLRNIKASCSLFSLIKALCSFLLM